MFYNSKDLYLIKVDDNKKHGLIISRIADIQDTMNHCENIRNKYFIAKKINNKFLLIRKTEFSGDNIYAGTVFVKVVKERPLAEILSNHKKHYTDKELLELENWINKVREDYKETTIINGEPTITAKLS